VKSKDDHRRFIVQEIAALYKLQLLVWPDLDMLNHEALQRAAPQVRIVTVETEELPSGKASSAALTGEATCC